MYVCLCNNVNDHAIREAAMQGVQDLDDLREKLGVASQCGQCACLANEVLQAQLALMEPPMAAGQNTGLAYEARLQR
jgi:bacterioferritin-associated ferredoxin